MKDYQIKQIKSLMESLGLTKSELAEKCNISTMTIHRILNEETYNPTQRTIQIIADALEVDEQDIMIGSEEVSTRIKINGYIEYQGKITHIENIKQLETLFNSIKKDEKIKDLVKEIKTLDKENKKSQEKTLDINTIDLFRNEIIDTKQIYTHSFRSNADIVNDKNNDLGNMATRYGFDLFHEHFYNSECAYICGLFSMNTSKCIEIQRELQASTNGYSAKKDIRGGYEKRAKECVRTDWSTFNVEWMKFVVWTKCKDNKAFRKMLLSIPQNAIIVENSTYHKKPKEGEDKAGFWGARNFELEKKRDIIERSVVLANPKSTKKELEEKVNKARNSIHSIGIWDGTNCMGKILTLCKYHLHNKTELPIDFELLRNKKIYLFGKLLSFEDEASTERPQRHKTIIFDFDGTLVDTRPLVQYEQLFKKPQRGTKEWKQGRKEYLSHVKDCPLWDGMDAVIEYIRQHHIPTCIVTANTKDRVVEAIKAFGWKDVFDSDHIIGCYSLGMKRASKEGGNPSLFLKALEVIGVEASDCVAFGNEISDTEAAQGIGIESYNCLWGASEEERQKMITIGNHLNVPIDILKVMDNV